MNFIYASICEALVLLIPLPASILLNKALGPENRGYLAAVLLIPSVVASIVSCNWDKTLRGHLLSGSLGLQNVFDKSYTLFIIQTILGFSISIVLLIFNYNSSSSYVGLTLIAILIVIPLQLASNYYISISNCINNQLVVYSIKIASTIAFFFSVLFFYFQDALTLNTAFLCNMMVATTSLVATAYILRSSIQFTISPKSINVKKEGILRNFPSHVLEIVSSQFDVWLILNFIGVPEAGAYLAFKMIELPFRSITFAILNFGAKRIRWKTPLLLIRPILIVTTVFVILLILFYGLSDYLNSIILFLLGGSYGEYIWIVFYIAVISAINNLTQILSTAILYSGKIKTFYNTQLLNSFLKIIFIMIFYYFYNFQGVFLGLIFSSLFALLILVLMQFRFHVRSVH